MVLSIRSTINVEILNKYRNNKVLHFFFNPLQIPRWDLDRFHMTSKEIGSSMKSVGEVKINFFYLIAVEEYKITAKC